MTVRIDKFVEEFSFLSNFYLIDLIIDGNKYPSVEHYYQACKALDPIEHEKIRKAHSPVVSKKIAKKIKSFRKDWDTYRLTVMRKALDAKFAIPELKEALLATDNMHLEEGNWWGDTFWGTCSGRGKNMLGKMLMDIRENLKHNKSIKIDK